MQIKRTLAFVDDVAIEAGGMATISGGMMAVYISYGADPV